VTPPARDPVLMTAPKPTSLLRPERLRLLGAAPGAVRVDAASVEAGPGASVASTPLRRESAGAARRDPRPQLAAAPAASAFQGAVNRMVAAPAVCDDSRDVTVLIVDDHPSFRANARALLEAEGFQVVGEAEDGASALRAAAELEPELVLLDVQLPDLSGFEVARRLTNGGGGPVVVLVSSRDGADFGPLVERSGARGFIPKAELSGAALSALLE
jgi:CheY-like chemotaxis protein